MKIRIYLEALGNLLNLPKIANKRPSAWHDFYFIFCFFIGLKDSIDLKLAYICSNYYKE